MSKIKVLLAEDHVIVRKGLRSLLDREADIEVVGEADNVQQAVEKAQILRPDIVLMDITMPVLNGLEATQQIKELRLPIKVVVLTVHATPEYAFQILRAGGSGYVLKHAAVSELIGAIRTVHQGGSFLSPSISRHAVDEYGRQATTTEDRYDKLTAREREVLQMVAEGRTNREIANIMHVTVKTVEAHRASLMNKLDLHSSAELTKYALRKGIASPE